MKNCQHVTNPKDSSGRSRYTSFNPFNITNASFKTSRNMQSDSCKTLANQNAHLEGFSRFGHPGIGSEEYIAICKSEPSDQSQHVDCIIVSFHPQSL